MNISALLSIVNPASVIESYRASFSLLFRHRHLAKALLARSLTGQYAGQALGMFWAIAHPMFLVALFIFVFVFVFRARIESSFEMPRDYTTYILAGLIPWLSLAAMIGKAPSSLTSQANLVKQVVFPIELAPIVSTLSGVLPQIVGTVMLVGYIALSDQIPLTVLLFPIVFGMHILLCVGIAFLLGSITPYFRDLKDFVQVFIATGVYFLPIVYLPQWIPEQVRPVLYLNPFSYLIWCYQDVFYYGRIEHPWSWVAMFVISVLAFSVGYRVFQKLKPGLGTVL